MVDYSLTRFIKSTLVTSFMIALALLWEGVILDFIRYYFPAGGNKLGYELLVSIIVTVIIIIILYVILKTEKNAEGFIKSFEGKKRRR